MERDKGLKLIEAICEGNDEEIDDLLKNRVDLDVIQNGDAAVHMAGRKGMLSVIKRLRRKGDNIGKENLNGHTAAHHAAEGGFLDVIKYLGECGVDLNAKNKEEDTPLHRAVVHQTMDVIEELVDIGMNPNARNKYGRTPVHTCAQNNRIEAMEALIISGAYPALLDKDKNKPEMLATSETMTDQLRMYEVMTAAFRAGCKVGSAFASQYGSRLIKAKCMRITHKFASTPQTIDRVGIIVEKLTIPKEFTSALYCRREKRENTTVTFTIADNEEVISDVFHIRISDSKKNVDARIYLPLYEAPSKTEQMVLLFIEPAVEKVLIDECEARNGTNFCPLQTTLVPDITCVCVVCVRPKVEHNEVDVSGRIITSAIEDEFSLEIPSGAFDENTVVTLQVFEASRDEVTSSEDADDTVNGAEVAASTPSIGESIGGASPTYSTMSTAGFLLTDAYQINLSGKQPQKAITVQVPLFAGCDSADDVAIVRVDETELDQENVLDIVQGQPRIVNCNVIFEISHFCICVACPRKITKNKADLQHLQTRIADTRDRRKPAHFFTVVQDMKSMKHVITVECGRPSWIKRRLSKWREDNYVVQTPSTSGEVMATPGDDFYVDIQGDATLEDTRASSSRKMTFSTWRSSYQPYQLVVPKRPTENSTKATADVIIRQKRLNKMEVVAKLLVILHLPDLPVRKMSRRGMCRYTVASSLPW